MHIGETPILLRKVTSRRLKGEKSADIRFKIYLSPQRYQADK
jgi:hypothetical protein